MSAAAKKGKQAEGSGDGKNEVDAFISGLDHPLKVEIEAVRALILAASPEIAEGIKWNAPSFRRQEWFATFHLRPRDVVQLILHLGAKAKDGDIRQQIGDSAGLLEWLGKDRATVKFKSLADIEAKREPFAGLVRQWVSLVP